VRIAFVNKWPHDVMSWPIKNGDAGSAIHLNVLYTAALKPVNLLG